MNLKEVSYRRILQLALPIIISQLGQITVGLVDNIMIGYMGTIELAAAAFVNNIFNLAIFFGTGVTFIITPLVGEAIGLKNKAAPEILKNALVVSVFMAFLITGILLLVYRCFPYMGQDIEVVKLASGYFILLVVSYLPLMMFNAFKQFAEGVGDTVTGMRIVIIGNIVNILGNYVFIFGKFGVAELGLNGAAIGTILSRLFMMFGFCAYFMFSKKYTVYTQGIKSSKIMLHLLLKITKKGSMLGLQMLIEAGAFGFAGIMIGWMGAPGLAAHQIVISLSMLGFMVYQGMGAATTILISRSYGLKSKSMIQIQIKKIMHLIFPLSIITSLFFFVFRNYLPLIFTSDAEVIKISSSLLVILAVFQLPDALQLTYAAAVRAFADVKIPVILLFISFFVLCLPAGYLLAFKLDLKQIGIWLSFPVGVSFTFMFLRLRFKRLVSSL